MEGPIHQAADARRESTTRADARVVPHGHAQRTGDCGMGAILAAQGGDQFGAFHASQITTKSHNEARRICRLPGHKMSWYLDGMSKISLERAFVEVINAAKGKESNLAFANRAFPELAMRSRVTMWGRLLNPDKATGKCRSLSIDEAERLAAAVGLRFEDVLWRARTYQAMGTIPPEENA